MKIIFGSFSLILGLAVILNSFESSSQSESPRQPSSSHRDSGTLYPSSSSQSDRPKLPSQSFRDSGSSYPSLSTKSGVPMHTLRILEIADFPVRKVRCPTNQQRTEHSTFMVKDEEGTHYDCTPDRILLAVGPLIYGHILGDWIRAIAKVHGSEILYDERNQKQIPVEIKFLEENFNVNGIVPDHIENLGAIYPFGVYKETEIRMPPMPRIPSTPSPATDSDCATPSGGGSGSHTPKRCPKLFSKIMRCTSSRCSKQNSDDASSTK